MNAPPPPLRLILVPAALSLVITLVRLAGELLGLAPVLFGRAAGGGGSLIGISWLIPVFGIYFAIRLARMGQAPEGRFGVLLYALGGTVVFVGLSMVAAKLPLPWLLAGFTLASAVGIAVAWRGWPVLARVLLAYAFAARIPVALVMLAAILGDWGTHYDVVPPNWPYGPMSPLLKWFIIGAVPQLTVWIGTTVVAGMLFAGIVQAVRPRRATPGVGAAS